MKNEAKYEAKVRLSGPAVYGLQEIATAEAKKTGKRRVSMRSLLTRAVDEFLARHGVGQQAEQEQGA
jgi:hypothetical protein